MRKHDCQWMRAILQDVWMIPYTVLAALKVILSIVTTFHNNPLHCFLEDREHRASQTDNIINYWLIYIIALTQELTQNKNFQFRDDVRLKFVLVCCLSDLYMIWEPRGTPYLLAGHRGVLVACRRALCIFKTCNIDCIHLTRSFGLLAARGITTLQNLMFDMPRALLQNMI